MTPLKLFAVKIFEVAWTATKIGNQLIPVSVRRSEGSSILRYRDDGRILSMRIKLTGFAEFLRGGRVPWTWKLDEKYSPFVEIAMPPYLC
jgi:hypothetical protein